MRKIIDWGSILTGWLLEAWHHFMAPHPNKISIDLETRSAVDLIACGPYVYASDPSTQIICMAWAFNDGPINTWCPLWGEPFPEQLKKYIADGLPLHAHNAEFEMLMFEFIICPDFDVPVPARHQWRCTAFKARCNNLPGSLYNLARSLGVPQQKDKSGRNLIQMLSLPQPDGTFNEDEQLVQEMIDYCSQDVRAERECDSRLIPPRAEELLFFLVDGDICDRGVTVDTEMVTAMRAYAAEEEAEIQARVIELTEGELRKFRGPQLLNWVKEHAEDHHIDALKVYRGGQKKHSLDKYSRHRLLDHTDLDPVVREAVECADTAMKSSVGKATQLLNRADPEDRRMRGAFIACGASQTGRDASYGAQLHNLPRDANAQWPEIRADLIDNIMAEDMVDYFGMPLMHILSSVLRATLMPATGHVFVGADWSAIEGRVNPWLANSELGEEKLDLYRKGIDTYKIAASAIYRVPYEEVSKEQRSVGKVAELALAFGGGVGAFMAMSRGYGVQVSTSEAEQIKEAWRAANPWAPAFWKACEAAARAAICEPGQRFDAGRLSYFAVEDILIGGTSLFCELPCGRLLTYPDARIEPTVTPWGAQTTQITVMRANWAPKDTEREWPRSSLWAGLAVENVTQAVANSLLRQALIAATNRGLKPVLHIHDEIVVESPAEHAQADSEILRDVMNTNPPWAEGLPLDADVEITSRFGK